MSSPFSLAAINIRICRLRRHRNLPFGSKSQQDSLPISKKIPHRKVRNFFGDPYGNRTHVTAVKGRCLNRLTNGPGSGALTRTGDRPGMNRVLYQLSYAAIVQGISEPPKSALSLYLTNRILSRKIFRFLEIIFSR